MIKVYLKEIEHGPYIKKLLENICSNIEIIPHEEEYMRITNINKNSQLDYTYLHPISKLIDEQIERIHLIEVINYQMAHLYGQYITGSDNGR